MTKLLQCLRDELVRRDYAATTIRSYIQIVDAFRQHTGARLDRITPRQLRRYNGRSGTATPRNCASCSPSRSATAPPRRGAPSGRISSDGNCGSR